MKHIRDEIDLHGKFETITAMDFRRQPGEVLESARLGKTFLITKAGKAIAVLSGLPGEQLSMTFDGKGNVTFTP
jgi:prevent-host-death family protein